MRKAVLLVSYLLALGPMPSAARSAPSEQAASVSATEYGVTCDGTSDDSAALIAATRAAVAQGSRDLVLPPGTCRILKALVLPSRTRWVSRDGTVILLDPTMTTGHPVAGTTSGITLDGVSDILFDGVTFNGGGSGTRPCPQPCSTLPRVVAYNASRVHIVRSTFRDFGRQEKDPKGTPLAYIQGLMAFGGSDWLVEQSAFVNNSGDGLAFSNATKDVEIRTSRFENNGDSALVCTIGGDRFDVHDNDITGQRDNISPIVVMDRCSDWRIAGNTIAGYTTGQGIRVARYGDTSETNHDFVIAGNRITGTATGISVEASAVRQGSQTVSDGGRFAVVGNAVTGAGTGIAVSDSDQGSVTCNTLSRSKDIAVLIVGYDANVTTGDIAVSGNVISGGTYGIRQLVSGGALGTTVLGPNRVADVAVPEIALTDRVRRIATSADCRTGRPAGTGGRTAP